MHRRDFCRLLAIAATSRTLSSYGQPAHENLPGVPSGFNRYTQDCAQFCALPPEKRVFSTVSDGKIVHV
jgi:alpha-L-fucosidase